MLMVRRAAGELKRWCVFTGYDFAYLRLQMAEVMLFFKTRGFAMVNNSVNVIQEYYPPCPLQQILFSFQERSQVLVPSRHLICFVSSDL